MIETLIKIFLVGLGILVFAILTNLIANLLGIETWYSFINNSRENGLLYSIKSKWLHLMFLIFIYPLILGSSAYFFYKILN